MGWEREGNPNRAEGRFKYCSTPPPKMIQDAREIYFTGTIQRRLFNILVEKKALKNIVIYHSYSSEHRGKQILHKFVQYGVARIDELGTLHYIPEK